MSSHNYAQGVPLRKFATLRAGGEAEYLAIARTADELAAIAIDAQLVNQHLTVLGWGSNVLPSDDGVPGLTVINYSQRIAVARTGEVVAESGCGLQELFLKTAQSRLSGLQWAVGIPGTLGGALVSNAGAYRSSISEYVTGLEVVFDGRREWVDPDWMEFSYRDSVLRKTNAIQAVITKVALKLPAGDPKRVYDDARDHQRQRIGKQPPPASAGSFFKNVVDGRFAQSLSGLPESLKAAGVVPAGFLIEAAGLKGFRMGGAKFGDVHANFILNIGGASAFEMRRLANHAKRSVIKEFGVELEEEVLYLGDWQRFSD